MARIALSTQALAAVILTAGCGRVRYDQVREHRGDASSLDASALDAAVRDASLDAGATPAWTVTCPWEPGFTLVESALDVLNDPATRDITPYLSPDGLSLYFGSNRTGDFDVYVSSRASLDGPFGAPVRIDGLSTPEAEWGIALSWDGSMVVLNAEGPGIADLFLGASPADDRSTFSLIDDLSSDEVEWDPYFTVDGTWIYMSTHRSTADSDIYRAPVLGGGRFGAIEVVAGGVSQPDDSEGNPTLLADGSVVVFNAESTENLYFARLMGSGFGARTPLPSVNTAAVEGEPFLRPDGCELFLNRAEDLYRATYVAP